MNNFFLLTLVFGINFCFSQTDIEYFTGKKTYCEFQNNEDRKLYNLGLESMLYKQYLGASTNVFLKLIGKDSTQCDAYFFAGYTFRLQNRLKEATTFYYLADSLSNNKSLLFKKNLASTAFYSGGYKLARKKYTEITEYFPESPEGYYGIAASSIYIGDFKNGLENINEAILKYNTKSIIIGTEVYLTKAILLTRINEFRESLKYFEKITEKKSKDDSYKTYYAYSLKKIGTSNNDVKMIKKADKLYNKINDKSMLTEEIKTEFNQ